MVDKKIKINEKEATVSVSRTVLKQQSERNKKIKIRPFVTDTASVSVKMGLTIPLGGYSSARVDVMISVPCYIEEIPLVYKETHSLVEKLIDAEAAKFDKEIVDGS